MLLASCSKGDPYRSEVSVRVIDSLDELQDIEKYQVAVIDTSMVDSITSEDVRKLMKGGRIVFIPFDDSSQLESFSEEYGIKLFTINKKDSLLGAILDTIDEPVLIPVNYLVASKNKSEDATAEVQHTELKRLMSEKSALLKLYSGYRVTKSDGYQDVGRFLSNTSSDAGKELADAYMPITEKLTLVLKPVNEGEICSADNILAVAHGLVLGDDTNKVRRDQSLLTIVSVTPGKDKKVKLYEETIVSLNDSYKLRGGYNLNINEFTKGIVYRNYYIEDDKSIIASASRSWESLVRSDYFEEKLFGDMVTVTKPKKNISYCIASEELIIAEDEIKSSELNNNIDIIFGNIKIKDGLFTTWVTGNPIME